MITVCTIAACNYLVRVRVLHESVVRTNPGVRFVALIVDDVDGAGVDEAFTTIDPAEVIDSREFARMATMYDVTELSTSLKPFLLAHVQRRFGGAACYLDPDIVVFGDLTTCLQPPLGCAVALTPHCLDPIPRDGLEPPDVYIQASGGFNLGYCAVANDEFGHRLLAWWSERLLRDAIADSSNHLFTDQRWMDLAVTHFPVHVSRDPTLNVAYWNVHERPLDLDGHDADGVPIVLVEGSPLTFFHFSGFQIDDPSRFSKYISRPRADIADPSWQALAAYYRRRLSETHRDDDATRYGFDCTAVGQQMTTEVRRRYRTEVMRIEHALTSLGWSIEAGRPPLIDEPPSAFSGDGGVGFAAWSGHSARSARSATVGARIQRDGIAAGSQGVNVVGYLGAETGVGESARLLWRSLRAAGWLTTTTHVPAQGSRHGLPSPPPDAPERPFDHDLFVVNADQTAHVRSTHLSGTHVVSTAGFWAWETERLPDHQVGAFEYLDRVLANSTHAADAIRAAARAHGITVPIDACPIPIPVPVRVARGAAAIGRAELGLPEGPLALFCFDYFSVFERKNPLATIAAFRRAFPHEGEATLVVKTSNGDACAADRARLVSAASDRRDIMVIDGYLTPIRVQALMQSADVYVSLHRCEGFGLTVAEAMASGTAVISTSYSGTMDFTTTDTAALIPYELTEIPADTPHYAGTGLWATPDVSAAADALHHLLTNSDERIALGSRAREHIAKTRDPVQCGNEIARLLGLRSEGTPT